jgi:hypothetical protein
MAAEGKRGTVLAYCSVQILIMPTKVKAYFIFPI